MAQADEIRERLGATYAEALEGLEAANGDTLRALAYIERQRAAQANELGALAAEVARDVQSAARSQEVTSAVVRIGQTPVFEVGLRAVGVAAGAAVLIGALISRCAIQLCRQPLSTEEPAQTAPEPTAEARAPGP